MALPTNKIKKIQTGGTTYDIVPEMLQNNGFSAELPTLTQNATIALTSDIPSGGGSGVTEISTQYTRIWDLATGVYKLTYNGSKYLYYNGATATTYHVVVGGSGAVILVVNSRSATYKHWYYINGTTSYPSIYFGYTSSTAGSTSSKALNNLLTSALTTLYRHSVQVTASITEGSHTNTISFFVDVYRSVSTSIITMLTLADAIQKAGGRISANGIILVDNAPTGKTIEALELEYTTTGSGLQQMTVVSGYKFYLHNSASSETSTRTFDAIYLDSNATVVDIVKQIN